MKVASSKSTGYQPCTLSLTLEGRDEFDAIYNLFNHVATCDYLAKVGIDPKAVREALRKVNDGEGATVGVNSLSAALKRWATNL